MSNRSLGSLTLDLIAKIGGFQQGMDQAARIADTRSRKIQGSMAALQRTIRTVFAALGAGLIIRKVIEATSAAETANAELSAAIKQTGGAAGFSAGQLTDYAESLQKATRFDDEGIKALETRLLGFTNITGERFTRTTALALDLATALKKDLPEAAQLLGSSLQDPERGIGRLRKAGIDLGDSQEKLIKRLAETGRTAEAQTLLIDALAKVYGGRAAASANTFGGALDQLKNAWDDLFEVSGAATNEAKESLQELTKAFQDPTMKQNAQDLAAGIITAFRTVTEFILGTVGAVKELSNELASVFSGPAAGDMVRIGEEIERVQKLLRSSQFNAAGAGGGRLRFFGKDGIVEWYSDEDLKRELARLRELLKQGSFESPISVGAAGAPVGTAAGTPTGLPPPPSEEFVKLSDHLKEQIALYGKVGEAAKVAYEIQSGGLDDLSSSEQQQLLALAKQYDALILVRDAAKKLADAYKSQSETYERQIALANGASESEIARYELTKGALKGLNVEQQAYIEGLAKQIDVNNVAKSLEQINLQILDLRGNTAEAIKLRFEIEHRDLEKQLKEVGDTVGQDLVDSLRQATEDQAAFNALREQAKEINDALARQEERIRNSQEVGGKTELEALQAIGDERAKSVEQLDEILARMEEIAQRSGLPELKKDAEQFRAELERLHAETNLLAQKIDGELKDAGTQFFSDLISGTKSAGDAFRSFIEDINRRFIELIAQNFAEKLFGGFTGGGSTLGNFIGKLFGGGRATGGPVAADRIYRINEIEPEYFRSSVSGQIIPLSKMPKYDEGDEVGELVTATRHAGDAFRSLLEDGYHRLSGAIAPQLRAAAPPVVNLVQVERPAPAHKVLNLVELELPAIAAELVRPRYALTDGQDAADPGFLEDWIRATRGAGEAMRALIEDWHRKISGAIAPAARAHEMSSGAGAFAAAALDLVNDPRTGEPAFLRSAIAGEVIPESKLRDAGNELALDDVLSATKHAAAAFRLFVEDIQRRVDQLVAQHGVERTFGDGAGLFSFPRGPVFGIGPGRAGGGPAFANWIHPVNEIEPEYFRSSVGGDIIPLSKMPGAGMTVHQHFSISAPQGRVSRQTEQQIAAAAARGIQDASRRNN